jgi:hypothetical protein
MEEALQQRTYQDACFSGSQPRIPRERTLAPTGRNFS